MAKDYLETYKHLLKFSDEILKVGNKIEDDRIRQFEERIKFSLPEDFKYFLLHNNEFLLVDTLVYGLGPEYLKRSLDNVYDFEHFEVNNPMPLEFLPFSPDGFGNHYCLNLSEINNGLCPIVFWQHDYRYSNEDEIEKCNQSYSDWIDEVMIQWTLEEYNYNGSKK